MEFNSINIKIGAVISFGSYNWHVLDVKSDKALLITENIIEKRKYCNEYKTTWETCNLRNYLNTDFLQNFTEEQQNKIEDTLLINRDNPWYGTDGGIGTRDKIFLLSLEEVIKYFGDSGQLKNRFSNDIDCINDQYNSKRIAKHDNVAYWWWLRTPGEDAGSAVGVSYDGIIYVYGYGVSCATAYNPAWEHQIAMIYAGENNGGVRPALWLKLYLCK